MRLVHSSRRNPAIAAGAMAALARGIHDRRDCRQRSHPGTTTRNIRRSAPAQSPYSDFLYPIALCFLATLGALTMRRASGVVRCENRYRRRFQRCGAVGRMTARVYDADRLRLRRSSGPGAASNFAWHCPSVRRVVRTLSPSPAAIRPGRAPGRSGSARWPGKTRRRDRRRAGSRSPHRGNRPRV